MKRSSITGLSWGETKSDSELERDGDVNTTRLRLRKTTAPAMFLVISLFCLAIAQGSLCAAQAQDHPQNQAKIAKLDAPGKPSSENPAETGSKNVEMPAATPALDPATSADIAKELAVMKARIEQLEAELKSRAGSVPASSTIVAEPKATPVPASAPQPTEAATTVASADAAGAQARAGLPEKPKPADPFAYADWTWLNGNSAQQRCGVGFEVLHSGNPVRY